MRFFFNKLISVFLSLAFLAQVIVPDVYACWWKGLPHQSPEIGGAPSGQGGYKRGNVSTADDVFLYNGDFVLTHQDLFIPSRGLNIEITRTYNSQSRFNGRFGLGWELNYNKRVVPLSNGDIFYLDGEGNRHRFLYLDGKNYVSPPEVFDKLVQNQDGSYTLTKKYGIKYNFSPNGTLAEIVDRNNNKLTFSYNQAGPLPIIGMPLHTKMFISPRVIAYQYLLTKITDATGREINLTYDVNGRLIKITDFAGRTISYTYDDFGHLTSVTDPEGNTTIYTYDSDRNLRSITDPKGNTYLTNTYNAEDQVIAQEFGTGTFYFSYDTQNRITKFTDRKGYTWTYYFDEQGNSTKLIDPKGNTTLKTYDTNKRMLLTSVTYPKANSALYEYDDRGNLTKITRKPQPDSTEPAIVTHFSYEPNYDFIKTITDPKGSVITYDYDEKGNLIKIIYPQVAGANPQSLFSYNQYGQLEAVTDPNEVVTKYGYYASTGYLFKIINDYGDETHLNITTEFSYDTVGNLTSVTDAKGKKTSFEYDKLNQLSKTTSPSPFNYQTKYTHDKNGNLTKIERQQDEAGSSWQTIEYKYDILDQLTEIKQYLTQEAILVTQYAYDANGNRAKITDAEGNSTTYTYDGLNLLFEVTDSLGNLTEYSYDANGNLKEIKDAQGNTTTYTYDDFDRLIKTTYADGSTEEYAYDAVSNLVSKTNPKGQIIYYDYDALNRLKEKGLSPTGTVPESVVSYAYDKGSRLIKVTDTNGTIAYDYDAINRITQVTHPGTKSVAYEYDANSNRSKVIYPDSTYITYTYDELNRLTAIKDQADAKIASYSYDALSRRTQLDLANNTQATYQYDNLSRLLSLINKIKDGANISSFSYAYDKVGNRLSMTTAEGTHSYDYDKVYQLVGHQDTTTQSHQLNYDAVGNRISTVNSDTTNYTSNSLNQYTKVGSTDYSYDKNGNLLSDGTNTYSYDYENRLISAISPQYSAISYKYDPFGRRIEKTVNSTTTNFLYDGDQLIAEYDSSDSLQTKYIFGPGIDEPICVIARSGSNEAIYYYHFDGLGSVTNLTDSTGSTSETYNYDAFGKPSTTSSLGNRFMFTGRELDSETGLYYYRARYYDPKIGRFLQRDPLTWAPNDPDILNTYSFNSFGPAPEIANNRVPSLSQIFSKIILTQGQSNPLLLNLYLYCSNNPLSWIDPFGWDKQKPWWERWWEWYLYESVLPGPYGQPVSEWGPYGPTSWGDPMKYTEEAGGAWMWAERAAVGISAGAAITAGGFGIAELAGWQTKVGLFHKAHHTFRWIGKWRHIQINIWKAGVKGSGRAFRIPLPFK